MLRHFLPILALIALAAGGPEEEQGVRYANRCEACKILATELQERLKETGKTHEILETGYSLDDVKPKKRTQYRRSELRLLESMEKLCERILDYNLHKERTDSTRFAKGMSQTFQTLHGLVDKGVKVDLGIPLELWDTPSVEVTQMKAQCENMLEEYEDVISDWYFKKQEDKPLIEHLCVDQVLKPEERKCLTEQLASEEPAVNVDVDDDNDDDDVKKGDKEGNKKKNTNKSKGKKVNGEREEL